MSERNTNLGLYLAKVEPTKGIDAVPTGAANAIALVADITPEWDYAHKNERDTLVQGANINSGTPLPPKGKIYSWSKSAWFRGRIDAITALNPIELDPWFQAAGLAPTYSGAAGAEQVEYRFIHTAIKSITEYLYHDGKLRRGVGALGEFSLAFDVGGPIIISCNTQGVLAGEEDAALPAHTFQTTTPPVATDATEFSVDGYTAGLIRRFAFNAGNAIARKDGVKAPGGVAGFRLPKRKPTWECVLEEPLLSEHDFHALIDSQADVVLSWLLGAGLYQTIGFDATTARIQSAKPSSDNGLPLITLSGYFDGADPVGITVQ